MTSLVDLFTQENGRAPRGNVQDEVQAWACRTVREARHLRQHLAPCVFHGDRYDDCIQHSGQVPCMTETESDELADAQARVLEDAAEDAEDAATRGWLNERAAMRRRQAELARQGGLT